jgi:hypothetical protein
MKVTEHVEHLLRQGRKPRELIELGFPKSVVTRVRRRLREEKTGTHLGTGKVKGREESHFQSTATPHLEMTPVLQKLESLESKIQQLESRVEASEALGAELADIETRINGTPALGLKHHFKCDCGASGYVALRIKCTKCGRETWWGWHPEQ